MEAVEASQSSEERQKLRGARMAQSVKRLTLDFGSGHDLTVCELEPASGSEPTARGLLGIVSLSLPLPLLAHMSAPSLPLSLSQNKQTLKPNQTKTKPARRSQRSPSTNRKGLMP